jgi:membrane fusion protein (multidrug efflux system)
MPMVEVVVEVSTLEPFQPKSAFVGRLQAREDVVIQARITSYLVSRNFREGEYVEKGKLLYQLDPAEYEAQLARAKADLAKARAAQAVALQNYNRGTELLPKGAISDAEMDKLTAARLEADASIAGAEAQIKTAEVNLSFTRIIAPISGRIGSTQHHPGDLIGPNTGPLTTLVSMDPIQAVFQVSESILASSTVVRAINDEGSAQKALNELEVSLELTNRAIYPLVGKIDYMSNRISEDTGTLEARALIPNPYGVLLPGQYVRVILEQTTLVEAVFVAQAAVQVDQQGNFVLVVDANGSVLRRNVELGDRIDDKVIVRLGLDPGEKVVVRGLQQIRPGQVVEYKILTRDS